MVGEHPDLYGFPELHLFIGDTLQEVIDREHQSEARLFFGRPGLSRLIAQLHDGVQTNGSVLRAIAWINEHRDWTTKQVMDYFLDKVAPKIGVEKSPITAQKPAFLDRAYLAHPDAFYLHLTRHPVSARSSWVEFVDNKATSGRSSRAAQDRMDRLVAWHHLHTNIMQFTSTLPLGQTMRIKGEDVLTYPQIYLPQIAEWMGIRTDSEAIDCMMHPERSPFAAVGPDLARGGNDPKFLRSPALRGKPVREPSLAKFIDEKMPAWFPSGLLSDAAQRAGLKVKSDEDVAESLAACAHELGYL